MNQPLIVPSALHFEKLAAETMLPEDPNQWSDEVLQELYKQVPYLADFDLNVVMETVDGERGYGLGHVEVTNKTEAPMTAPADQLKSAGIREARIPVIIKDGKLTPFDVLITDDSKTLPLTESRMRQALFRPQNFDVTSKTPGDQSMIGQLYPPYRQNYGFGGGGVGVSAGMGGKTASPKHGSLEAYLLSGATEKTSAPKPTGKCLADITPVKTGSVLEAMLQLANVSDLQDFKSSLTDQTVKQAYVENVATYESLERIDAANPTSLEKSAQAIMQSVPPSVLQVTKVEGGYRIKTASHLVWAPSSEFVDRGELVRRVGTKIALATDMAGATTVGDTAGVSEEEAGQQQAGPISAPGMYHVQTVDGEMLTGSVITNLIDVDGMNLPIALFTDGQHAAVQADISGVPVGEFSAPGTTPAEQASGHGVFYTEHGGVPFATIPLTIGASIQSPGTDEMPRFDAETFDGRKVQVSVQPYVHQIVSVDNVMLIPEGWSWLPLDSAQDVDLAESPEEVQKMASLGRAFASVQLRAGGADCFSLRGHALDKLAGQLEFLNQDDALFLLVGLGAEPSYAQRKMAQALGKNAAVDVRIGRAIKTAAEVRGESYVAAEKYLSSIPSFRHRMWKEAAAIPDPVAVDSVLSLGFLNPENISTCIGYLPTLDEAQRRLCELLIVARLGMRELSEGALERAIRALENVIEGLKVVAFQE